MTRGVSVSQVLDASDELVCAVYPLVMSRLMRSIQAAWLLSAAVFLLLAAPVAQAQTATKLVGNTGVTPRAAVGSNYDYAQTFTTGGNAAGYRLTRVDIRMLGGTTNEPTYRVSIHSDSSNSPGTSLGTLTNPASWPSSAGLGQHTASGDGIALAANTTYWLVFDVTANTNPTSATRQSIRLI